MQVDETEAIRRNRQDVLNLYAGEREVLETRYGKVWNTDELREEFEVLVFMAPLVVVRCLADGKKGSLEFQHHPRFYFNWQEY
jgi:hypothetical protein